MCVCTCVCGEDAGSEGGGGGGFSVTLHQYISESADAAQSLAWIHMQVGYRIGKRPELDNTGLDMDENRNSLAIILEIYFIYRHGLLYGSVISD